MATWGERLRERAKELKLADSDVARRLGLDQSRYSAYVNMRREPDFATFSRICHVLQTTPDVVLGFVKSGDGLQEAVRDITRATAALAAMDSRMLALATSILETMADAMFDENPADAARALLREQDERKAEENKAPIRNRKPPARHPKPE